MKKNNYKSLFQIPLLLVGLVVLLHSCSTTAKKSVDKGTKTTISIQVMLFHLWTNGKYF